MRRAVLVFAVGLLSACSKPADPPAPAKESANEAGALAEASEMLDDPRPAARESRAAASSASPSQEPTAPAS